jgi:AcrR family transcriptional regulator
MATASKRIVKVDGRNRRPWALASKDRILAAATAEIASVGFDRARLTEIAKRADMTPGSVYTWFENKEDLFRAALEDALTTQIVSNATTLDESDHSNNWLFQIATLVPRNSKDTSPTDAQMLLIESYYASWRDPKARKKLLKNINSHLEMYTNIILNGQAQGAITKDIDATAMATMLLAIPTGLSLLTLAGVPRIPESKWESIYMRFYQAVKK